MMKEAVDKFRQGANVLYAGFEDDLMYQMQHIYMAMHTGVNPDKLKRGELDETLIQKIRQRYIDEVESTGRFNICSSSVFRQRNISEVRSLIETHKPDILFMDGCHTRLATKRLRAGAAPWEHVVEVVEESLQLAEEYSIPVFTSWQMNRNQKGNQKKDKDGFNKSLDGDLNDNVGGSKYIVDRSTVVLTAHRDMSDGEDKRTIYVSKNKEGANGIQYRINFKYNEANFKEIREDEYSDDDDIAGLSNLSTAF